MKISIELEARDWGKVASAVSQSLLFYRSEGAYTFDSEYREACLRDAASIARIKQAISRQRKEATARERCLAMVEATR